MRAGKDSLLLLLHAACRVCIAHHTEYCNSIPHPLLSLSFPTSPIFLPPLRAPPSLSLFKFAHRALSLSLLSSHTTTTHHVVLLLHTRRGYHYQPSNVLPPRPCIKLYTSLSPHPASSLIEAHSIAIHSQSSLSSLLRYIPRRSAAQ